MIKNLMMLAGVFVFFCNMAFALEQLEQWQDGVKQADAVWWEVAYNHCDEKKMTEMLADDFEFVHDEIGIYRGKQAFVELTMKNICQYSDRRREVVPGTMSYEPLRNVRENNKIYGAVVSGEHMFYEVNPGVPDKPISRARFTHVMLFDGTSWKLFRAISYGHRPIFSDKK